MKRLVAIRGATTAAQNDAPQIVEATEELLREMLGRNEAAPEDLVSVIFTSTPDLDAEFPAAAARSIGLSDVPLLCAGEIPVPGALARCIRVLMHLYSEGGAPSHVYLRDARSLRSDLA